MTTDESVSVSLRMRDVAVALLAAAEHSQRLPRIRLQKFVYLMDSLALVFKLIPQGDGYVTYKRGPFDKKVQNAVDALAFRGLVSIAKLVSHSADRSISVEYELSGAGRRWADRLARSPLARDRAEIAREVGRRINKLGWARLVELVYAEPTFVGQRPEGFGRVLDTTDGLGPTSARLLQLIVRGLAHDGREVSRQAVLDVYFRYLGSFAREQKLGKGAS